jgi:hypothetical protein
MLVFLNYKSSFGLSHSVNFSAETALRDQRKGTKIWHTVPYAGVHKVACSPFVSPAQRYAYFSVYVSQIKASVLSDMGICMTHPAISSGRFYASGSLLGVKACLTFIKILHRISLFPYITRAPYWRRISTCAKFFTRKNQITLRAQLFDRVSCRTVVLNLIVRWRNMLTTPSLKCNRSQ